MPKKCIMMLVVFLVISGITTLAENMVSPPDIADLMNEYNIHTCSIVYRNEENKITENFGRQDFLSSNEVTENSIFEIGSNGKMVAAYIVHKLVEENKINLDDKAEKYLDKEWVIADTRFSKITIRQLLSHSAGFSPSFEFGIDKHIYFEPGTKFSYSGVGYMYLQEIIEKVSGLDFESAAQKYVFVPLKMNDSTFLPGKVVTPYIHSKSLTVYCFTIFILSFSVIFIIGLLVCIISKFKKFNKKRLFTISILVAGLINSGALLSLFPKIMIIFAVFAILGIIILFVTRKTKRLYYAAFILYTAIIIAIGLIVPFSIPVPSIIFNENVNCAYSMRSTSKDMSKFCDELLEQYNKNGEMFDSTITIDDNNSWCLGIASEKTGETITYWHSGINPGQQSIVIINPTNNSYVIVLTNSDNGYEFSKKLARLYLNIDGVWEIERVKL